MIIGPPAQRLLQGPVFLEPSPSLHDLLRLGLIAPEVGLADALLDVGELLVELGTLKDASVVLRPGGPDRRIAVPDLRVQPPRILRFNRDAGSASSPPGPLRGTRPTYSHPRADRRSVSRHRPAYAGRVRVADPPLRTRRTVTRRHRRRNVTSATIVNAIATYAIASPILE